MYGHLTFSKDSKDWKKGALSLTRLKGVEISFPSFTELSPGSWVASSVSRSLYLMVLQTVKMS